jgi:Ca2+-binding EF-hand superfamily protein
MSISGVGPSAAGYASSAAKQDSPTASDAAEPTNVSTPSPATTVVWGERPASEISLYTGTVSSLPISVTAAPQLFVQADKDHDNALSLEEFKNQLKRVGVSSEAATQLFNSLNTSKGKNLSLDDFVNGVVSTNKAGNSVFQDLYVSYTTDEDGKFDMAIFNSLMAQGESVAGQYWAKHPELQRRG